ncbi:ATP-grasp domain-containing protein [Kitasatospora sp. NPDC050543]|uniref:ATP-grasp domain-containing protein n=1 Tax=Kitasatospora sp. NPDC050543 TaxID=3364054 RepID=UPI0037A455CD
MERNRPELDREVPVLLVKVGHYPQSHSAVGAVRTFGRVGVPVYAMVEDRLTPTAVSRYLTGAFIRPSTGRESPEQLVAGMMALGREIGRPTVAVSTDDESAVLLAEHAGELSKHFLLPPVPAGLPRRLANKGELHSICRSAGTPTPRSCAPADRAALIAAARRWGYPVVLKNLEPFTRLSRPVVGHTTVVQDEAELLAACALADCDGEAGPSVLAQEYLPGEQAEDWFTHLCCGPGGEPRTLFTGLKLRSWPPEQGVTTRARALPNPELAALTADLCRSIGYSGVADLDWRLDLRDGRYKLVDFNPRTGAQFRLFETEDGVDVLRALHLSLTGRPVPQGAQLSRSFAVGQLDLMSTAVTAWRERRPPRDLRPRRGTERAWLCRDDLGPAVAEAARFGGRVLLHAVSSVAGRRSDRR